MSQRKCVHDETSHVELVCAPVRVSTIVATVHFCDCTTVFQLVIISTVTEPGKYYLIYSYSCIISAFKTGYLISCNVSSQVVNINVILTHLHALILRSKV